MELRSGEVICWRGEGVKSRHGFPFGEYSTKLPRDVLDMAVGKLVREVAAVRERSHLADGKA